jgi:hypothetical protein
MGCGGGMLGGYGLGRKATVAILVSSQALFSEITVATCSKRIRVIRSTLDVGKCSPVV